MCVSVCVRACHSLVFPLLLSLLCRRDSADVSTSSFLLPSAGWLVLPNRGCTNARQQQNSSSHWLTGGRGLFSNYLFFYSMENRYFTILAPKLSSVWLITVLSPAPTYRKENENFIVVLQSISEWKPSLCKTNPLLIPPCQFIYLNM